VVPRSTTVLCRHAERLIPRAHARRLDLAGPRADAPPATHGSNRRAGPGTNCASVGAGHSEDGKAARAEKWPRPQRRKSASSLSSSFGSAAFAIQASRLRAASS
jgi:hypothetical protein